ncbi:glycerophosphodiester phosphodiesterase family protein [Actinomyces minihominis]|uniref:glycerophosphodiester phosphodiesterase family protein n=1 Tax=Actinomyces minihominis TaxID=2002838 RepID=UPI000C084A7D|nr:glycerophosphodiester phosphodiesterase family protein [Actinomyces minihominis]
MSELSRSVKVEDHPIIFSHRGLNLEAPENTMAAFRLAHARGVQWIETDIDVIADETPILMHDATTDRTTNRPGSVYDLRREDLSDLDAGSWFGPQYVGEPVPTLDDLVAFANETGMNLNVELKANQQGKERSLILVEKVAESLSKLEDHVSVMICCFSPLLLAEYGRRDPSMDLALLTDRHTLTPDWRSILELAGATYLHPEHSSLTPELTQSIRDAGFGINPWTVNSMARANELINWGCTGIITDVADVMMR